MVALCMFENSTFKMLLVLTNKSYKSTGWIMEVPEITWSLDEKVAICQVLYYGQSIKYYNQQSIIKNHSSLDSTLIWKSPKQK